MKRHIPHFKTKLLSCGLAAGITGILYFFQVPCLLKTLFRIPCPGCGMTRAYVSLLHGDILQAFQWHPMFWSLPLLIVFYFLDGKLFKQRWLNHTVLILVFAGFFAQWLVRLIIGY